MLSLVIPVYKNEANLPRLFRELETLAAQVPDALEVVFVVDGSPDASMRILREQLPSWPVRSRLVELSRNFGSFPAIAAGLQCGRGDYFAAIAADLQEPPELVLEFYRVPEGRGSRRRVRISRRSRGRMVFADGIRMVLASVPEIRRQRHATRRDRRLRMHASGS